VTTGQFFLFCGAYAALMVFSPNVILALIGAGVIVGSILDAMEDAP
jgi:hypothetical protein